MKKIRKSVFETNSSSTHSITLCDTEFLLDNSIIPDEDGNIVINGGDFGWEHEIYNDAWTKLNYIGTYIKEWYPEDEVCISGKYLLGKKIEFILNENNEQDEIVEHLSKKLKVILTTVIKEQTGCNNLIFDQINGYIDHQSVEDKNYHYLFEEPEKLRNFIFNKKSILKTDSDG